MLVDEQREVVAFLMSPAAHGGAAVERADTHISIVVLAGARALKLKRAVRFDYVDFSTPALRRAACEAEVRVNRRTAPALYRGVLAVTREAEGALALDGRGTPIDWVVEMARFDQDALLDRIADRGALTLDLMPGLASAIAGFHLEAERRADHGGRAGMAWVVDGNAEGFADQGRGILDPALCGEVTRRSRAEIDRHAALLERRRLEGAVRHCHGDLHLRNIVLLDGRPTLFDGIEFNDEIACVDVLYDLAFLIMDLWRRRLPSHANALFNAYLARTADLEGLALLPLFLSCRAAVRAKTSASASRVQKSSGPARALEALSRDYLTMAGELLRERRPVLVALGGRSGSGKSTVAFALAPGEGAVPGALVLRSDEIRKALCGVPPLERLGPEGYTPEVSRRVYATLAGRAAAALRAGHSVIVDAVFARPEDRAAVEQAAVSASVPFAGLWLDAPAEVLVARVGSRRLDASDADARVVSEQLAVDPGPMAWERVDASREETAVTDDARARIAAASGRAG